MTGSKIYPTMAGLFGEKRLPEQETLLRRNRTERVALLAAAAVFALAAVVMFLMLDDDRLLSVGIMIGCAVLMLAIGLVLGARKLAVSPEGLVIKKRGEDNVIPYDQIEYYECTYMNAAVLHADGRRIDYRGEDAPLLIGALRAAGVPSYDPMDAEADPDCIAVKHISDRKPAVITLLAMAALWWLFFLIPEVREEAFLPMLIVFGVCSLIFVLLAVMLLRQKVTLYRDCFYVTKAFGREKRYDYDCFESKSVKRVYTRYSYASADSYPYSVVLRTREGKKLTLQSALIMPELLERIGFDGLRSE